MQQVGHDRHDQRLRDGLTVADRQGPVVVGARRQIGRHELLARHFREGRHDPRIEPTGAVTGPEPADLALDDLEQGAPRRRHGVGGVGARGFFSHAQPGRAAPISCRR